MKCGRAWKFGDDINTDVIIPGRYLDNYSPDFLAEHVMEGIDPTFSSKVSKGDIIIAGKHFGIGSSRQAAVALKAVGVEIVLAESFARIFYRNAINQGMLPIVCPGCSSDFENGEEVCVDVEKGTAISSGKTLGFQKLSPIVSRIHDAGGLAKMLRIEMEQAKNDR